MSFWVRSLVEVKMPRAMTSRSILLSQITLDTYSHVLPALHGDAITRLEALFAARFPCLPQRREFSVSS